MATNAAILESAQRRLTRPTGGDDLSGESHAVRVLLVGRRVTAESFTALATPWLKPSEPDTPDILDISATRAGTAIAASSAILDGASADDVAAEAAILDRAPVAQGAGAAPIQLPIQLVVLTNQRIALQEIRTQPPKVVLIELDAKPDSRARFCEMIRYRLATALIFALSPEPPQGNFVFDGHLHLPLRDEEVWRALNSVRDQQTGYVLTWGPIRLNVATRTVMTPNGQRHMTPKQSALLQMLMAHAEQVVNRKQLMETIWETSYMEDTRTLDVHIRWLRECIEPDPSNPIYLYTARGQGYCLRLPEA